MAQEIIVDGGAIINGENAPILTIVGDRPMVSSIKVAEHFEKRHDNVVRDIKALIDAAPECALNFEETFFHIPMPKGGHREVPAYDMDEDGFSLLAMGFTGKKAVRWKISYTRAFRSMRNLVADQGALSSPTPAPAPAPQPLTHSTPHDRQPLKDLVDAWVGSSPISYHTAWKQVHAHFGITAIGDLPREWIPDAIAFVQERIDKVQARIEAREVKALPAAGPDLKAMSAEYYHFVIDTQIKHTQLMAEVERKSRELTAVLGAAITPHIGQDNDPSAIVARSKFLDALNANPRSAIRAMDMGIIALMDHAQLMCGLSVLGR